MIFQGALRKESESLESFTGSPCGVRGFRELLDSGKFVNDGKAGFRLHL